MDRHLKGRGVSVWVERGTREEREGVEGQKKDSRNGREGSGKGGRITNHLIPHTNTNFFFILFSFFLFLFLYVFFIACWWMSSGGLLLMVLTQQQDHITVTSNPQVTQHRWPKLSSVTSTNTFSGLQNLLIRAQWICKYPLYIQI